MSQTLIIYAHPYPQSFNGAILAQVKKTLASKNKPYDVIDLCADNFDPRYSLEELALYSRGETVDPLVKQYQDKILQAGSLIFIAPIWWSDVPAILKGFIDKVMKKNFAYTDGNMGLKGLLTHIGSATIITTSAAPTWYLRLFCGNAIKKVFLKAALKQVGITRGKWLNCGRVSLISQEEREKFLLKIDRCLR